MSYGDAYVYVIFVSGFCKVGMSHTPRKRMSEVQTGCPLPITRAVFFRFSTRSQAANCEAGAHVELAASHSSGEWFVVHDADAVISAVSRVATGMSGCAPDVEDIDLATSARRRTMKRAQEIAAGGKAWQRKRRELSGPRLASEPTATPAVVTYKRRRVYQRH